MDEEGLTPEQQQARLHFTHAMQQAKRGHIHKAVELAEEAVECDPAFLDARRWLAETYEQLDEPRKASRHLQEIIHRRRDDQDAWAALERVDPGAAARLKRVSEIGPDPFVAQRRGAALVGELGDMDDLAGEGIVQPEYSEDLLVPEEDSEELLGDMEEVAADAVEEEPVAAGAPAAELESLGGEEPEPEKSSEETRIGEPQPWEHEEDRPYRDKMLQDPLLSNVIHQVRESWEPLDGWRPVLDICAHAGRQTHKALWATVDEVCRVLNFPEPMVLIVPEGNPHLVPIRETELEIAYNTGLMRCMEGAQLVFAVARGIAILLSGATAFYQATLLVTDRSPIVLSECEEAIKEYLWDIVGTWFESHAKEQKQHAAALAHAWQMRCVLSCDRAGLLACGNVEAACDAVARMTCRSAAQAQQMNWRVLLEKYKGQDPGKLAAIPIKEDPSYSEPYAVYRIQMLRWWFTTDEYKTLAGKYRAD